MPEYSEELLALLIAEEIERITREVLASQMYREAVGTIADTLAKARMSDNAALLTRSVNPVALKKAQDLAQTAAQSLVKDLTQTQLKSMGDTIAQALADGKRPRDIYNKLQEVQSLDSNRAKALDKFTKTLEESGVDPAKAERLVEKEKQRLLQERRKTIAQNEGRVATSEARRSEADERGNEYKRWIATGDERMCEVCGENADAGVIALSEEFPSGHDHTPAHPNCHCTISYLPGGKAKEISEKRAAREKEARAAAIAERDAAKNTEDEE